MPPRRQSTHQNWSLYLQPFRKYRKVGHVTRGLVPSWPNFPIIYRFLLVINLHTKSKVCIFRRSLDMEGVPKFQSRSRDPGPVPSWPNFATFWIGLIAINPHTKFDVSDFSRSLDMEGVPKCKSRSRDVGHAPFDPQNVVIYVTFYKFDILAKFRF